MRVSVGYEFLPKRMTSGAAVVMDQFGIGFETGRHVIAEGLELPIGEGDLVLFTGASGSGKSSLMRAVVEGLKGRRSRIEDGGSREANADVLDVDELELGERILVDGLGVPVGEGMRLLAACGLGEARLMLRTPAELSDGQRYRFRLAMAVARRPRWVVADEFTATLDRTLARVVAFNIRRLCDRTGIGFLLATTHEDVVEDLRPTVHVRCGLEGRVEVVPEGGGSIASDDVPPRPRPGGLEGAEGWHSASQGSWKSRPVPRRTGRTLLGGIIGGMGSGSCGS